MASDGSVESSVVDSQPDDGEAVATNDAFMSYSHAGDGEFAPRFQRSLERTLRPFFRARSIVVFRDETGFSLTEELWPTIEAELKRSSSFVLLASEKAAGSRWVDREVEWWLAHGEGPLVVVLTSGEIVWDSERESFDERLTTALPPSLLAGATVEPGYGDARALRGGRLKARDPGYQELVAKTYAAIKGLRLEDVLDRERNRLRRQLGLMTLVALAILFLIVALAWFGREVQRDQLVREANRDLDTAERLLDQRAERVADVAAVAARSLRRIRGQGRSHLGGASTLRRAVELYAGRLDRFRASSGQPTAIASVGSMTVMGAEEGEVCILSSDGQPDCASATGRVERLVPLGASRFLSGHEGDPEGRVCGWGIDGGQLSQKSCWEVQGDWYVGETGRHVGWLSDGKSCHIRIASGERHCEEIPDGGTAAVLENAIGILGAEVCLSEPEATRCGPHDGSLGSAELFSAGDALLASEPGEWVRRVPLEPGQPSWQVPVRGPVEDVVRAGDRLALVYWGRPNPLFDVDLLDPDTGRAVLSLSHRGIIDFIRVSPSGRFAVTGGTQYPTDGTLSIWTLPEGREVGRITVAPSDAFVRDDGSGVVLSDDGEVLAWEARGRPARVLRTPGDGIEDVVVASDGGVFFQTDDYLCRASIVSRDCAQIPDGDAVDVLGSSPGRWAWTGGGSFCRWPDADQRPRCVEVAPGQTGVAVPEADSVFVSSGNGVCERSVSDPLVDLRCFGRDGDIPRAVGREWMVVQGGSGDHRAISLASAAERELSLGPIDDPESVAVSEDGAWVAVAGSNGDYTNGYVRLFSTRTEEAPEQLSFGRRVHAVAFDETSSFMAVGTGNGEGDVSVWSLDPLEEIARIGTEGHARSVSIGDGGSVWSASGGLADDEFRLQRHVWALESLVADFCNRGGQDPSTETIEGLGLFEEGEPLCPNSG